MSSVFLPFTSEEVESIKSVVMLNQQSDDMLLSNSTRRPLAETRAFIRRFKKFLVDQHTSSEELANMGNQQYVAIITAARAKRKVMSSAHSMMNLSLPFTNPSDSLPLKFRTKFSKLDSETDSSQPRPSLPTRSRSVFALNQELEQQKAKKSKIPIFPAIDFQFPHGCKSPDDITPGDLAAVMKTKSGPPIIGRVIALKEINGAPHALVTFFLEEITPSYLPLNHLVMLKHEYQSLDIKENEKLTVDAVLKRIIGQAQSIVLVNDEMEQIESDDKLRKNILFQALSCSANLQLLAFVANWQVPEDKMLVILKEVRKMAQPKYKSTEEINNRCNELIMKILQHI